MPADQWTAANLPNLTGRTVIVTGASSGIGEVTARELAGVGANVILAVRNLEKGAAVAATIAGTTEVRQLDLSDLGSVRAFADSWTGDIDILINNAGIMAVPEAETADGFEQQIGTNHLGHFALTNLLLPFVTDRVVTVSSEAHRMGRIHLDDLNWERRRYSAWRAYGQSKLANLLFTLGLQLRLDEADSAVRALAVHPGTVATNLYSQLHGVIGLAGKLVGRMSTATVETGALPTLYAATQNLPGNTFVGPGGRGDSTPRLAARSSAASDLRTASALWELSEELTKTTWPVLTAR